MKLAHAGTTTIVVASRPGVMRAFLTGQQNVSVPEHLHASAASTVATSACP